MPRPRGPIFLPITADGAIEWVQFDLHGATGYDDSCADAGRPAYRRGVERPFALWRAPTSRDASPREGREDAGIKAFCYTSSVSVYGSGAQARGAGGFSVLTPDRDIPSEYWGDEGIRIYGGRNSAAKSRCGPTPELSVTPSSGRPSWWVIDEILKIEDWPLSQADRGGPPALHFVYVRDVAEAHIWAMEQSLKGVGEPGSVTSTMSAKTSTSSRLT